jgi:hypothetical protein
MFFIHSLVVRHLGQVRGLAIVNSAAIHMGVQVSLLHADLHSFEKMPSECWSCSMLAHLKEA